MKVLLQLSLFHFYLSMAKSMTHRYSILSPFLTGMLIHMMATPVHAENCSLCSDGSYPVEPQSKFTYTKNGALQAITCDMGYSLAPQGEFANCTTLHLISSEICQCGKKNVTKFCNLCYLGEKLPNPTLIIANKTCAGWEAIANNDFASNCPVWQKTLGNYCGCSKNSTMLNGFCSLCAKPLPDPNAWVRYTDGTSEFCTSVEVNLNTKTFPNCTGTQSKYRQACGCDKTPVVPGITGSSGGSITASLVLVFASSLFVMHLLL